MIKRLDLLLRKMREALLVFGKNVDKEEILEQLANEVGLDPLLFMQDGKIF